MFMWFKNNNAKFSKIQVKSIKNACWNFHFEKVSTPPNWTLPQNLCEFLGPVISLIIYLCLFQIIVFRNFLRRKTFRSLVLRECCGFVRGPRNGPSIILHYELVESTTHQKESKRYIFTFTYEKNTWKIFR